MRLRLSAVALFFIIAISSIGTRPALAGDDTKLDKKVVDLVMKAGDVIKNAKSLHAEGIVESVVQGDDKQQTKVKLSYDVEKPNRIALHSQRQDDKSAGVDLVSNGKTMFTNARRLKQYTEKEAPDSLAEIAVSLPRLTVPQVGILFRNILTENPGETLIEGVTACSKVGEEKIDSVTAHHLKFSQPDFDWELWVAAEGTPYILKMLSNLSGGDNKLVLTETYKNWKINEPMDEKTFTFVPSKDAKKVKVLQPPQQQDQ
jgi:hypothetical protein